MKRSFAAIGSVVVAAVVLWLALRGDEGAPAPERRTGAEESPPEPSPQERDTARRDRAAAPPSEGEPTTGPPPTPDAPAPPQTPPTPTTVAEADSSGVLTVVGHDGTTPVAGATVMFRSIKPSGEPVHLATDAEGRVRLPTFVGTAGVRAQLGGDRGVCLLDKRQTAWTLQLTRYVTLRAIVRDPSGAPVGGVPVALLARQGVSAITAAEETTRQEDGIAQLEESLSDTLDGWTHELAIALPLPDRSAAPVDLRNPPTDPVVIVLPPTGRVVCEVQTADGDPAPDGRVVVLRHARVVDHRPARRYDLREWDDVRAKVQVGRAEFPWVGLGLDLEVRIESKDDSCTTTSQTFVGPREPGEEVTVSLTGGGARPVVTGRLVNAKGVPMSGIDVHAQLLEAGEREDVHGGRAGLGVTDATGRFRFAFDLPADEVPDRKLWLDRLVRSAHQTVSRTRLALIDLPPRLPPGETDVGDVVVPVRGLVVEGIVVDPAGTPLAGAVIRAFEIGVRGHTKARDVDGAVTDVEGRFRLVGTIRGSGVGLGVDLDGWFLEDDRSFTPGTTDARVVLRRAGAIAGSVRAPENMAPYGVRVHVSGEAIRNGSGDRSGDDDDIASSVDRDGRFEFRCLRPGTARVEIRLGFFEPDTVLVVDDVKVVAGEVTRDPRLAGVDPAKLVRFATVTAVDPDGRPLAGAEVQFRPTARPGQGRRDNSFWDLVTTNAEGRATVRFPRGASEDATFDVVVKHAGFRSAVLIGVRSDATATLVRARPTTVRVRLAPESPIPPSQFALIAYLEWCEPDSRNGSRGPFDPRSVSRSFDAAFGTDRVLIFTVPDPGRYRVCLGLIAKLPGEDGGPLRMVPDQSIFTVGESGDPVEVVVGYDATELERVTKSSK